MKNEIVKPDLPDYHIHTPLCGHAEGDVHEYKTAARSRGVTSLCFTDHAPTPDGYDPAHRMTMDQFPLYKSMVSETQTAEPPLVLFGIEADYYEGCENHLRSWLPEQNFDFVIGSVHFIDGWGFDNPSQRHVWDSVDVTGSWRRYFCLLKMLVDSGLFDAVGHFDLPKKFGYRPEKGDLREMALPVLDRMAELGIGLEINTSGLRKPVKECYPSAEILSWSFERCIPICFGSDAHKPQEIGFGFDLALDLALEAGYSHHFTSERRVKELKRLAA